MQNPWQQFAVDSQRLAISRWSECIISCSTGERPLASSSPGWQGVSYEQLWCLLLFGRGFSYAWAAFGEACEWPILSFKGGETSTRLACRTASDPTQSKRRSHWSFSTDAWTWEIALQGNVFLWILCPKSGFCCFWSTSEGWLQQNEMISCYKGVCVCVCVPIGMSPLLLTLSSTVHVIAPGIFKTTNVGQLLRLSLSVKEGSRCFEEGLENMVW